MNRTIKEKNIVLPSSIPSLAKKEEALSPKVAKELARLLKVQAMVPPRPDGWRQSSAASRGVSLVRRLQARGLTPISSLKINKQQSVMDKTAEEQRQRQYKNVAKNGYLAHYRDEDDGMGKAAGGKSKTLVMQQKLYEQLVVSSKCIPSS